MDVIWKSMGRQIDWHYEMSSSSIISGKKSIYLPVISPPGHYQLGIESLTQLEPLVNNTSSKDEIIKSGFLSRQGRTGGINLCSERNSRLFRPSASDTSFIHVRDCLKLGTFFFGNFFTDVILCTGSWDDGVWNGKIPLECLHFKKRKWSITCFSHCYFPLTVFY